MTDQDRCTDTNPHPAHRTQYGSFGVIDCPGVPMASINASISLAAYLDRQERDEATEDRDLLRAENANLAAGLRAERVTTGRLEGDLRSQTRAVRELTAERDAARQELGAAGEVLAVVRDAIERIDRALATYDTTPGEATEREDDAHPWQEYNAHGNTCHYPGCLLTEEEHVALAVAPSSVPSRRAQEPQPGQFCAKHFSWLCQAGQGRCQNDAETTP